MSHDLRVNYLYMEEPTRERFELACDRVGWALKNLAQQCIHAFLKKNQAYYIAAARLDYEARGMTESEYYLALRDGGEDDMKPYRSDRPKFDPSPLDTVPMVKTGKEYRRRYGVITLSGYNFVLLKVCQIVDRGPMIQVISRIVRQHFDDYWENYRAQIERDDKHRFE
jgi:hypothetical protein